MRSGGDVTVTELVELLSDVLLSAKRKSGLTTAVLDKVAAVVGVTGISTVKLLDAGRVTAPPLALQINVPEVMEQSKKLPPVTSVFVTDKLPYVGPDGNASETKFCVSENVISEEPSLAIVNVQINCWLIFTFPLTLLVLVSLIFGKAAETVTSL